MRYCIILLLVALFACQPKTGQDASPYVAKQNGTVYWAVTPAMDSVALAAMSQMLLENGIFFNPFIDRDEQEQPVRIYGNLIAFDRKQMKPTDAILSNSLLMPDQQKRVLAWQSFDVGHTKATLRIPPLGFWYDLKTGLHSDEVKKDFPEPLQTQVAKDFSPTASAALEKENANRIKKFKIALAMGKPAFGFTLPDSSGRQINLSDYKGKVVYLDFWAHWCLPCMQEMRETRKLKKQLAKYPDVVFLYISIDDQEDKAKWISAINRNQFLGTHLLAAGGFAAAVPRAYGINEIPTKFIIDRKGNFYDTKLPYPLEPDQLMDLLKKAGMDK